MIAAQCVPYVLMESSTLNVLQSRIHGLDHWFRVWQNAQMLIGTEITADLEVVALYALFHDSMRVNDEDDPGHGMRGFTLWERINQRHEHILGKLLTDPRKELFFEACAQHSDGRTSTDPTIAVCWDADRLDLPRKGIWPDSPYLSTHDAISLTINRLPNKPKK